MRIYGRITIYGEYLMHGETPGLIMPSDLFLDTVSSGGIISHYSKEKDDVLLLIIKMGITPDHTLYGNLPLGYGMAGSTTLSLLHLNGIEDKELKQKFVNEIDNTIHGFTPSGLDFESCIHQEWGLFCNASGWQSICPIPIAYSLFKFPKENSLALSEVQKRVLSVKDKLEPFQNGLNSAIKERGALDLKMLMNYSSILLEAEVYSRISSQFISTLLKRGIIAKGVGGLYDKVIMVVHSEDDVNLGELIKLAAKFKGEMISNVKKTL